MERVLRGLGPGEGLWVGKVGGRRAEVWSLSNIIPALAWLWHSGLLPSPPRFAAGVWRLPPCSMNPVPSLRLTHPPTLSAQLLALQTGEPRPGDRQPGRVEVPGFHSSQSCHLPAL